MTNNSSREITREEERKAFIEQLIGLANYWATIPPTGFISPGPTEIQDRIYGMLHSFLVLLDGGSGMMPSYYLAPCSNSSDKDYFIKNGENYHKIPNEDQASILEEFDIGGALHEEYHDIMRKKYVSEPTGTNSH